MSDKRLVEVTVEFIKLGEIDTMNEKYSAEIFIETKWIEPEPVSFYDAERHWNPKLFIENALQEPKEKIKHRLQKISWSKFFVCKVIFRKIIQFNKRWYTLGY